MRAAILGELTSSLAKNLPENTQIDESGRTVDIVGGTTYSAEGIALGKGDVYRVDIDVNLTEAEFWLNFSDTQTLSTHVYTCPTEAGTYTEIFQSALDITGTGAAWYSCGAIDVPMNADNYYLILIAWSGTQTYYWDAADSQDTSFGAHVLGYWSGAFPMPATLEVSGNDQAVYHQRLTTGNAPSSLNEGTWGDIKALYK